MFFVFKTANVILKLNPSLCLALATLLSVRPEAAFAAASIRIQEVQTLTFPTLAIPTSGTASLTLSPLNSSTSGNAQIIRGAAARGQYTLTLNGGGSLSISIDITGISTGNSGLTLSNFTGLYQSQTISSFPSSTLPLPSKSGTPLYLGATITATPAVPVGSYTGRFSITVFVQ